MRVLPGLVVPVRRCVLVTKLETVDEPLIEETLVAEGDTSTVVENEGLWVARTDAVLVVTGVAVPLRV